MEHTKNGTTKPRPPVVAVLGHIDHGKSTLLDFIRSTNLVADELGGITQHVHAYEVLHSGEGGKEQRITFIDTPGHAAFKSSRSHGIHIADVGVIIISAEEGAKEQTLESIKTVENAHVPYVIAINKIDRPNANVQKIKQGLAEKDILVEGYGGKIPCVEISAKTGVGIEELLDIVVLTAELEDLTYSPGNLASGFVLESETDKQKGIMASLVIKDGTLKNGMFIVTGGVCSKVKQIEYFDGSPLVMATCSQPIKLYGLSALANPGNEFLSYQSKKDAEKAAADETITIDKVSVKEPQLEDSAEDFILIPLVIKADVSGSLEAIEKEIARLSAELPPSIRFEMISTGIGEITESDLKRAETRKGTAVIGFGIQVDQAAKERAMQSSIKIKQFDVIYTLSDYLKEIARLRTPKESGKKLIGVAKVIKLFSKTNKAQLVGAHIKEGKIRKELALTIVRNEDAIGKCTISEFQVKRADVTEASEGTDIGVLLLSKIPIKIGDELHSYEIISA